MTATEVLYLENQRYFQEGIEKGINQGRKQGRKTGIQEGIKKVAKRMIELEIEIQDIMNITGLKKEEILKIKEMETKM